MKDFKQTRKIDINRYFSKKERRLSNIRSDCPGRTVKYSTLCAKYIESKKTD